MNLSLREAAKKELEPSEGTCAYYFKLFKDEDDFRRIIYEFYCCDGKDSIEWGKAFTKLESDLRIFLSKKMKSPDSVLVYLRDFIATHAERLLGLLAKLDEVGDRREIIAKRASDLDV